MITRLPQDWGKQRLQSWRAQQNHAHTKTQRKRVATPRETEPKPPAGVRVSCGGVGRPGTKHRVGHWEQQAGKVPPGVNPLGGRHQPYHRAHRPEGWVASGQTTTREGMQPYSSADNWSKALLSKALPTRARPSFPHQSLPSRSLHKRLSLLHQRPDRKNK